MRAPTVPGMSCASIPANVLKVAPSNVLLVGRINKIGCCVGEEMRESHLLLAGPEWFV
jgi:hypothetical protein